MKVTGVPMHTLVRGRFVMKDRQIVGGTRGWGRSVRRIQRMPPPQPKNSDQTLVAVTRGAGPAAAGRKETGQGGRRRAERIQTPSLGRGRSAARPMSHL